MFNAFAYAALVVAATQDPGEVARDLVLQVCVPFVADGTQPTTVLRDLRLSGPAEAEGRRDLQTRDEAFLVRLSRSDGEDSGDVRRACVVQSRAEGFEQVRDAVTRPLEQAGFVAGPDEPADWPVWTRRGVIVSVHKSPGRATVIRTSYSSLEAEGP